MFRKFGKVDADLFKVDIKLSLDFTMEKITHYNIISIKFKRKHDVNIEIIVHNKKWTLGCVHKKQYINSNSSYIPLIILKLIYELKIKTVI